MICIFGVIDIGFEEVLILQKLAFVWCLAPGLESYIKKRYIDSNCMCLFDFVYPPNKSVLHI